MVMAIIHSVIIASHFYNLFSFQLVDRSKNSSRKDGISHKIGDHKHQFRRKDLGGSNLLSRITANLSILPLS